MYHKAYKTLMRQITEKTQTWKNKILTFTSPFIKTTKHCIIRTNKNSLPKTLVIRLSSVFSRFPSFRRLHAYVAESKRVATRRCWFITAKSLRTRDLSQKVWGRGRLGSKGYPVEKHCKIRPKSPWKRQNGSKKAPFCLACGSATPVWVEAYFFCFP